MLIVAAGRGHPASLQAVDEPRMMVQILTDDASGGVIPEARQPLSHALRIARGMASMWPSAPRRIAEYLQSVCTWEDHLSSGNGGRGCNSNNQLPPPALPLTLPPQYPDLHRFIDLKTYDEMLEPENFHELVRTGQNFQLMWLMSTEFLSDEEVARRMLCFHWLLPGLQSSRVHWYRMMNAAGAFRRWHCVEVVLDEWGRILQDDLTWCRDAELVLCRAFLDAVHGEPGCAGSRVIGKLFRAVIRGFHVYKPFRGGWFGWKPFRLAFVEREQDREQRETAACMEMRDVILDCLPISDQNALNILLDEPSKALYRVSTRRCLMRLADKRERGKVAGGGSSFGENSLNNFSKQG